MQHFFIYYIYNLLLLDYQLLYYYFFTPTLLRLIPHDPRLRLSLRRHATGTHTFQMKTQADDLEHLLRWIGGRCKVSADTVLVEGTFVFLRVRFL